MHSKNIYTNDMNFASQAMNNILYFPSWQVVLACIIVGYLIYYLFKGFVQNVVLVVILAAIWILAMPTGVDAAKEVWQQPGARPKLDCAIELSKSLDWWDYSKPPSEACDK